jgi:hypothetical protein
MPDDSIFLSFDQLCSGVQRIEAERRSRRQCHSIPTKQRYILSEIAARVLGDAA